MGIEGIGPADVEPSFKGEEPPRKMSEAAKKAFAALADAYGLSPDFRKEIEQDLLFPKEKMGRVIRYLAEHGEKEVERARANEKGYVERTINKMGRIVRKLRIYKNGDVEICVGRTRYNLTHQTVEHQTREQFLLATLKKEGMTSVLELKAIEQFLAALEKEGITSVSELEAIEMFAFIQKNRARLCKKAASAPFGVVYVKGEGYARGIQFNKDGSVYIHLNKRKKLHDREVGSGAFKKVRFAFNVDTGKRLIVARLYEEKEEHRDALRREVGFLRELKGKPGIAGVIQLIQVDGKMKGKHFFIQPYYNQDTLFDGNIKGISDKEQRAIAKDLLQGAAALEEAGIIHRDIKPENIFLHRDDKGLHAYIADFGAAVRVNENQASIEGTFGFLPPELSKRIQPQNSLGDMWALGRSINEMREGRQKLERFTLRKPRGTLEQDPIGHLCRDLLRIDPDTRLTAKEALAKYGHLL